MKNYVKPEIMEEALLSEGVYAGSGDEEDTINGGNNGHTNGNKGDKPNKVDNPNKGPGNNNGNGHAYGHDKVSPHAFGF